MKKEITFVTGNWAKVATAKKALEPLGYKVDNVKMETPEIQADDVVDVAKYSAKWACEQLESPVIKVDCGLFVKSLKGFPGVYTHYADDTIGEDGLLKLMEGIEDRVLGTFPDEERWNFWSLDCFTDLVKYLEKKK